MMERLADEATHGATTVVHLPRSERFELFERVLSGCSLWSSCLRFFRL